MQQRTETAQAREAQPFWGTFELFGEQMATWGEEFGRQMEAWGREFGQRIEAWGREFGPRTEAWAEELVEKMEQMGVRFQEWFQEQAPSPAAKAHSSREERLAVLRMVEEGRISVTEAESLLCALGEKSNHFIIERYLDRRRPL